MEALFFAFWRILLLRSEPQSVPASSSLLWLVLLLHYGVGFLLALFSLPFSFALLYALVSTLTMVAVVHGLLLLFRKHVRYTQSLTALAACEALLGLLLVPVSLVYYFGNTGEEFRGLLAVLSLLVLGWNVALTAHIFRHALGVSGGIGFIFSIVYLLISMNIGEMVSVAGGAG
ncbi:MAG: hypothetical protein ABFS08_12740 [Pseudomonadota bacterium]